MTTHSLLTQAIKASQNAYAPYSKYKVGAAILTVDGNVYTGCNVENASYGLTVCAERIAVFKAISEGHKKFSALALAAGKKTPGFPCGACLQVLAEFCPPTLPIYCTTLSGKPVKTFTLRDFLPHSFTLKPAKHTKKFNTERFA